MRKFEPILRKTRNVFAPARPSASPPQKVGSNIATRRKIKTQKFKVLYTNLLCEEIKSRIFFH
ncbi:hypothetical protein COU96_01515 [Candidatus Shapirobacteria bacterium CG10_big_fil_rev_8_21_14_0_10_38_14]|uniref:Uncharacterized protein n=1 Tax=Candidatus Shapirobacteria bacterium CG10_big_fil_rev_8_21_14_0_10_38_14 TaxID=1974483 RepID=A0A2M8L5N4_9BACT|nr:MAG: hypothetical protein COU96_01515 [Candidatus Shapirobacteria bacterium CG10_big_fil_rev_8_21_14_0_10_38_14]